MALQIVPSENPPPVEASLILAFAGIPQSNPLRPNGRVFRKLAGDVSAVYLDGGELVEITYEEAFVVRFERWLPDALRREFRETLAPTIGAAERRARIESFMTKLDAHKKACPPPWETETVAQVAQERAA